MEIMKVFTIQDNLVSPGAKANSMLSKSGKRIPIICVGEQQWQEGFRCLPVVLTKEQEALWNGKKNAKIFYTRLMRCKRLAAIDTYPNSCEHALIVFKGNIGQGGSNSYLGDLKDDLKTYDSFPGRILKKGKIGHFYLGKVYTGTQVIAIVPKNTIFSFVKKGQMQEQNKEEYFFYFDGHDIFSMTKAQRLNYSLFPESRF